MGNGDETEGDGFNQSEDSEYQKRKLGTGSSQHISKYGVHVQKEDEENMITTYKSDKVNGENIDNENRYGLEHNSS